MKTDTLFSFSDSIEHFKAQVQETELYDSYGDKLARYKLITTVEGKPISIVSNRYNLIQNSEVIDSAMDSLQKITDNFQLASKLSYHYPNKMKLVLLLPDLFFPDNTKDGCSLAMAIQNSYTGERQVSVTWMSYRYWCMNGAMTLVPIKSIHVRHTKALNIDAMRTIYEDANIKLEKISESVKRMMDINFIVPELMSKIEARFPRMYNAVTNETYANAYDFYNHCTKFITHTVAPRQRDVYYSFLNSIFMKEGYIK